MAVILDQRPVGDGYDVRISTAGRNFTLHFRSQPSDAERDEHIKLHEWQLMEQIEAEHIPPQEV